MSKTTPNSFTIKHREYGYTLDVNCDRPRNAPKYKYTKADAKRNAEMAELTLNLIAEKYVYDSLDEVVQKIKELENSTKQQPK